MKKKQYVKVIAEALYKKYRHNQFKIDKIYEVKDLESDRQLAVTVEGFRIFVTDPPGINSSAYVKEGILYNSLEEALASQIIIHELW